MSYRFALLVLLGAFPATGTLSQERVLVNGTAEIAGTVQSDGTPARAVRRATVTLSDADSQEPSRSRMTTTDEQGRFMFDRLPTGRYTLVASIPSYVTVYVGSRKPGIPPGAPIALARDQHLDFPIVLMRGAAISGTIRGVNTQLVPGLSLQLLQFRLVDGETTLLRAPYAGGFGFAEFDESGRYRLYGVAPGEYILAIGSSVLTANPNDTHEITAAEIEWALQQAQGASRVSSPVAATVVPRGPGMGFVPVFYPGTTDPSTAMRITLTAGEERSGIDFPMLTVPTATVAGRIVGPNGQALQAVQASMFPVGTVSTGRPPVIIRPLPNGQFSSAGVPAGDYVIVARAAANASSQPLWAQASVSVTGQDTTGLTIELKPGRTILGKVAFDSTSGTQPPDPRQIQISLRPTRLYQGAALSIPDASVAADGTFQLPGVADGSYQLSAMLRGSPATGSSWMLQAAFLGESDALETPVDINALPEVVNARVIFTDRVGELSGKLLTAGGRPAPDYFVIAFPIDPALWGRPTRRIRQVRPDANGGYVIRELPPGDYYLGAMTDVAPEQFSDPALFKELAAASLKITVQPGEKKTQDLKLAGGTDTWPRNR